MSADHHDPSLTTTLAVLVLDAILVAAILALQAWAASSICTWHLAPVTWSQAFGIVALLTLLSTWGQRWDREAEREFQQIGPARAFGRAWGRSVGRAALTLLIVAIAWAVTP